MLDKDILQTAVARGIITSDQSNQLIQLGAGTGDAQTHYSGSEEKFRFFKGFNEIFLSVGLLIFTAGLIGTIFAKSHGLGWLALFAAPVVIWLLAEYFVTKKSYVLPGIVLAACFAWFCALIGLLLFKISYDLGAVTPNQIMDTTLTFKETQVAVGMSVGAFTGALIFYLRFKVPFTLLVAAGSYVLVILNLLVMYGYQTSFAHNTIAILLLGTSVFALAMVYDLSDPQRRTRAAVCAFWLHLMAAPLIVHAVMAGTGITLENRAFGTNAALIVLAFILALSVVALMIDRRALLVSAFIYLGWAIAHLVKTSGIDNAFVMAATLLLLGAIVLVLGTGWQNLRNRLLGPVRTHPPFKYLPPLSRNAA